jgi:hypothetical protein
VCLEAGKKASRGKTKEGNSGKNWPERAKNGSGDETGLESGFFPQPV